ncbi:MAG: OmpA family protein, partial [Caulobacteraceae bacterium]
RYSFAQAAPPPPPPPEPPAPPAPPPEPPAPPAPEAPAYAAKEFIVYFPFDQSILTPEAQAVVSEAAQYAQSGNATQIVVVGHADTSGSAKYNVGLSQRRSKAVADALVGLGVNSGTLSVDWKGESEPAVATGDGVKEPLNRRSTIQINF